MISCVHSELSKLYTSSSHSLQMQQHAAEQDGDQELVFDHATGQLIGNISTESYKQCREWLPAFLCYFSGLWLIRFSQAESADAVQGTHTDT